jgi:hypothetical protein
VDSCTSGVDSCAGNDSDCENHAGEAADNESIERQVGLNHNGGDDDD